MHDVLERAVELHEKGFPSFTYKTLCRNCGISSENTPENEKAEQILRWQFEHLLDGEEIQSIEANGIWQPVATFFFVTQLGWEMLAEGRRKKTARFLQEKRELPAVQFSSGAGSINLNNRTIVDAIDRAYLHVPDIE